MPQFWLILLCIGIPSMIKTDLTFHLVSILNLRGVSPAGAVFVLSLIAITVFPITMQNLSWNV
ncbi:hypothetical protein HXA31_03650 [Salipaludibacillus agaradhaerens]|uniref:Uncharacterized protein n=1 Tax=Salipaludibacillus agaradhaerens TaxID=76935 RepID=A0A9Q4FZT2_SALAG|nr:hypothetical protein [Salipaludibacillus agaradhaerens]MCR6097069.1 hypothetical protein [Salipaludibacillus agaradhaerens]MCR6113446.1 hypothetical protein [Salipaludibacillus agaradhaerens]